MDGVAAPFYGIKILKNTPGLLWYATIPVAIQTALTSVILGVAYLASSPINAVIDWFVAFATETATEAGADVAADTLAEVGGWTKFGIWAFLIVAFMIMFFVLWRFTGGILTGYFGGRLTDKAMKHEGLVIENASPTTAVGEVANGFFFGTAMAIPEFFIGAIAAIPGLGTLLAGAGGMSWAAALTGYNELRDPFEKMGLSRTETLKLCLKFGGATLALGGVKTVTEPIPFIGGVIHAIESLGRITLAKRIMWAEGRLPMPDTPNESEPTE